jgi:predicted TIM-barrel fold metal-dependent hydrolase
MDDLGIDVSTIMVMDWGMAYMAKGQPDSPMPIREINRHILSLRDKYPSRVYGFCGVDPRREGSLELFETAVNEWGAVGLKVYPPYGFYASDSVMTPFYQKASDLGVPVLIHTGGSMFDLLSKWSVPEPVEEVAVQFPDLNIIWGHANLQGRFESGSYWRAIQIAGSVTNLYLDLSDWQVTGALDERNIDDFWHVLDVMRNSVGAHRILWGTDMPMTGRGYDQTRRWVQMFESLPEEAGAYGVTFTQEETELICYQNAERLLGIKVPHEVVAGGGA